MVKDLTGWMNERRSGRPFFWSAVFLLCLPIRAHVSSAGFLSFAVTNELMWAEIQVAIRDVDDLMALDGNGDGFVVWSEVEARKKDIFEYLFKRIQIETKDGPWISGDGDLKSERRSEGGYAVMTVKGPRPSQGLLSVDYTVFAERDPQHRVLVKFTDEISVQTAILGTTVSRAHFVVGGGRSSGRFGDFVREGVYHIWTGYDHLAFLIALLLPAVVRRTSDGWIPAVGFKEVFNRVLRIVTAFTVAHSLTLAAAGMGLVSLPSRWVETAIAASILAAVFLSGWPKGRECAEDTIFRKVRATFVRYPAVLTFGFGLIHGFGFASVLGEFGLKQGTLAVPLLGFNLGVEMGQIAGVVVLLPGAYLLRQTRFYREIFLPVGLASLALFAVAWMVDRVMGFQSMPF